MKAQERPGAQRAKGADPKPIKSVTGEWDGKVAAMGDEFIEMEETTERVNLVEQSKAQRAPAAVPVAEAYVPRERRATVVSSIPAQLAKSMGEVRDPAAPLAPTHEVTRRVPDSQPMPGAVKSGGVSTKTAATTSGHTKTRRMTAESEAIDNYSVELIDEPHMSPKEQVAALIDRARGWMEGGNLGAAVIAADQALAEAAKAQELDTANLIKAARPLFDRIFADYVGLLGKVPVRTRTDEQIAGQELGDRTRLLLAGVNGTLTLEQLSSSTGIPPVEAMKIAASLLAAGIISTK
jgi:hypothetical protein